MDSNCNLTYSSDCTTVVFSLTYKPSKNLRISLSLTVVECWMCEAESETASISFPSKISSSFCLGELKTVTPGCMCTRRMCFSPRKLRISINVLASEITQLMGKWACTERILYWNPLVTPKT